MTCGCPLAGSERAERQAGSQPYRRRTARTNMVERTYKDVRDRDERSDRERLDIIAQKQGEE